MHFKFAYFYFFLIHLELKRYTCIRSYAPVGPSKTIPDFRPKWAKCIPVFRPKRPKNHIRWDSTYLYGLYKGVPSPLPPLPPPWDPQFRISCELTQ